MKDNGGTLLPMNLMAWLFVIFACFIAGGGIYIIFVEQLTLVNFFGTGWSSIMPFNDRQTIIEGLGYMLLSFFMVTGLYLSYTSTKVRYDPKKAQTYLILGAILLLVGLFGSQYLMSLKRVAMSGG